MRSRHALLLALAVTPLGAACHMRARSVARPPSAVLEPAGPGARADAPAAAAAPSSSATPASASGAALVLGALDPKTSPCDDFYRYACGGWLDATELPGDQVRWGRGFSTIYESNLALLREILEQEAAKAAGGGAPQGDLARLGVFYASCMDEAQAEELGAKPLAGMLAAVDRVSDPAELLRLAGELHRAGVAVLFSLGVDGDFKNPEQSIAQFSQGGLGLPDRDYYLKTDEDSRALLGDYEAHVARQLAGVGIPEAEARLQARAVVGFETRLAEIALPREALRDPDKTYNKLDVAGLERLAPRLAWKRFLEGLGHAGPDAANIAVPSYFEGLDRVVSEAPSETLRAYLRWHVVSDAAPYLSRALDDEDFAFFGRRLSGQKEQRPRWKRCVSRADNALGEALGRLWVERRFAGESKALALEMIHRIEAAFEAGLPELAWMDDVTRERAREKLAKITNKIGYPDRFRDYAALAVVPGDHFANVWAAQRFEMARELRKIGMPVDRDEWYMTPPTVNAYYNPSLNEIVFPGGIMQPPFFDRDFPAAMNYGAIGVVMGHEVTHGFDDEGRKFDGTGRLRSWWEPEVSERFEAAAGCVERLYSGYEVLPGLHLNGKLTLGENIADMGGVKEAFRAYRSVAPKSATPAVPGLTDDQLFFVAFAQSWCSLATPEIERLLVTVDPHSSARFRVNGPVSNLPEFWEAFGCPAGSAMRKPDPCVVW